jgi:hypothetical protein
MWEIKKILGKDIKLKDTIKDERKSISKITVWPVPIIN